MLRLLSAMAVAAGVALAACGSSGTSSSTPASSSAAATSSSASTSTATATATVTASPTSSAAASTASGTTPAAAGGACAAAHLSATFLGGQGATGHGELGFALRNTGPTACHTYGYPGIEFQSASGAPLPTTPQHTTGDFFGSLPLRTVTVAPGQSFSFRLGTSHGNGASTGCSTAHQIAIIPPDDTVALHVTIPNGGAIECGATSVSPVQPGVTAYR